MNSVTGKGGKSNGIAQNWKGSTRDTHIKKIKKVSEKKLVIECSEYYWDLSKMKLESSIIFGNIQIISNYYNINYNI